MIHELKIKQEYFAAVYDGSKKFEVRQNDRNIKVGDYLALNEFDDTRAEYTGRSILVRVTYILDDEQYCKQGFAVFGFVMYLVF